LARTHEPGASACSSLLAPARRGVSQVVSPRTDLRELGLERRAIDAVFRALPLVALPGYSRPLIREADYLELIEQNAARDGECVR